MRLKRYMLLATAVGVWTIASQQAVAQVAAEQPGENASPSEASAGAGEIVVTARQRREAEITVPAVTAVFSSEALQRVGVTDIYALSQLTPQLVSSDAAGPVGSVIALRGVSNAAATGSEMAVALNFDGLTASNTTAMRIGQFDMQQVEVLKGPQALFFGKNSPGGVISFVSRDPGDEFEMIIRGQHEFAANQNRVELAAGGPISSTLGVRIAGFYDNTRGYFRNPIFSNGDPKIYLPDFKYAPDRTEYGGRLTLVFEPSDALRASVKLNYVRASGAPSYAASQVFNCPTGSSQQPASVGPDIFEDCTLNKTSLPMAGVSPQIVALSPGFGDGRLFETNEQFIGVANIRYEFAQGWALKTIFGGQRFSLDGLTSQHGAYTPVVNAYPTTDNNDSAEARIESDLGGAFDVMFGGYIGSSTFKYAPTLYVLRLFDSPYYRVKGETQSVFGQVTWRFLPNLDLEVGGRYTHEKKSLRVGLPSTGDVTQRLGTQTVDANDFSPEVVLAYRPSSTLTAFASYKEGFKSGGFNLPATAVITQGLRLDYGPERVRGFEAGLKAALFDRQLRVNASIYTYKYLDHQVTNWDVVQLINLIQNVSTAKSRGAEIQLTYSPNQIPGLTVDAALSYSHARYGKYTGPCYSGQKISEGCNQTFSAGRFQSQVLDGKPLPYAPDWSGNFGINYDTAISSSLRLGIGGSLRYVDSLYPSADVNPFARQKSVTFFDAQMSVRDADDKWELALIGRNLTNKLRATDARPVTFTGTPAGTATSQPADLYSFTNKPREVVLRLTIRPGF